MAKSNYSTLYPYSFINTLFPVVFLVGIIGFSVCLLESCYHDKDFLALCLVYTALDGAILAMVLFVVNKYMLPALQGKIAIELNDEGLIDHMKNVMAKWKDISDIHLGGGRGPTFLYITFKADTDYDSMRVVISYVKGRNNAILNAVNEYLERNRNS